MACLNPALGNQEAGVAVGVELVDLGRDRSVGACDTIVGAFAVYDHGCAAELPDVGVEDPQALGRALEVRVGRNAVAGVGVGRGVAGNGRGDFLDFDSCYQAGRVGKQDP